MFCHYPGRIGRRWTHVQAKVPVQSNVSADIQLDRHFDHDVDDEVDAQAERNMLLGERRQ